MSRAADKFDIDAVADLLAVSIASALFSGGSYTYEDARRTNADEGWTYERTRRERRDVERVESMHLTEEQLSLAWLTANRRVDNDQDRLRLSLGGRRDLAHARRPKARFRRGT